MRLGQIIILAIVQGLAELLPVSSSAHVIAAARFLKQDPTTPQFGLLLVLLHTGTMFAVIIYFWKSWQKTFFSSFNQFVRFSTKIFISTAITGGLGYGAIKGIEKIYDPGFDRLESWSVKLASGTARPTDYTLLSQLVFVDRPNQPAFAPNDKLVLAPVKGKEPLDVHTFEVTPTARVRDLCKFLSDGFELQRTKPSGKTPETGYSWIITDPENPVAAKLVVVGNVGTENRVKYKADMFVSDTAGSMAIGFWDVNKAEVEHLFKKMDLIAAALGAAGLIILISGLASLNVDKARKGITTADSVIIGIMQGLCLPFRGFSRSGATISTGLLRGIARQRAEEYSFALAVVLTPAVIGYEALRLYTRLKMTTPQGMQPHVLIPGLEGMAFAFLSGLVALKILSKLLEKGQWWLFGLYCFAAAGGMYWLHLHNV